METTQANNKSSHCAAFNNQVILVQSWLNYEGSMKQHTSCEYIAPTASMQKITEKKKINQCLHTFSLKRQRSWIVERYL